MNAPIPQRRRSVLVIVLAMLAALAVALPGFADNSVDFELDGDVQVTPDSGNADWATFFDGSGPNGNISLKSDTGDFPAGYIPGEPAADHALPDTTTFTQGSKDTLDISDWTCTRSNNVNNKVDIVNAYSAGYREPDSGDLHLYFGVEIRAPEGNSNVGIWFLKEENGEEVGCERLGGGSEGFSGSHTIGDVLLVAAFTNGGLTANIDAYEWKGSGGSHGALDLIGSGSRCQDGVLSGDLCATVNDGDLNTPWNSPTRSGGDLERNQFFEGGINITQHFGTDPADECFTRFLANTRSSQSLTATLFDYATGVLPICGGLTVEKETDPPGVDQDFNFSIEGPGANESFTLNASGTSEKEYDEILAGSYRITEQLVGGWDLIDVDCGAAATTPVSEGGVQIGVDVVVGVSGDTRCTFTNRLRHSIVVEKVDDTTQPLPGAVFVLTRSSDSDSTDPDDDDFVGQLLVQGDHGHLFCIQNLEPGNYWVHETEPPDGYEPKEEAEPVTTRSHESCSERVDADGLVGNADLRIRNDPTPRDLVVNKIKVHNPDNPFNPNGRPLAGFTFQLFEGHGDTPGSDPLQERVTGDGPDDLGEALFTDLLPGNYRVCETGAPDPAAYWTEGGCQNVTVVIGADPAALFFYNEPLSKVTITFENMTGLTQGTIVCDFDGELTSSTDTSGDIDYEADKVPLGEYDCTVTIENGVEPSDD